MPYVHVLPDRYVPLHTLDLCTNVFVNVSKPIAIKDFPILLIAGGLVPVVWLAAPRFPGSSDWHFVVAEGRSANPAIQVAIDASKRETVVTAGPTRLICAVMMADDRAQVTEIDLRPVGLNVIGSKSGLMIGTNRFANNRVQGASIGIALG